MALKAPVAIVTGAGGGIGSAIVSTLLQRGFRVIAWGRRAPSEPVAGAEYDVCDVSNATDVGRARDAVLERTGRIDVLVTSAAILKTAPLHEMAEELWDEVQEVNLKGVFLCCRAVLPAMMQQGGGSIVNLSSVHAIATVPGTAAYAASKGAIVSLSRQIAVEYADYGIRSNSVVVGSVDTEMSVQHGQQLQRDGVTVTAPGGALGRMARPEEIAAAVAFLAGNDSSFVTGSAMTVDGGLTCRLM